MAVEVALPLTREFLTSDERGLLGVRVATDLSYLGFLDAVIDLGSQSENGRPVDLLIEKTLKVLQDAPEEGILVPPEPLIDAVLDTMVLDTQLHRNIGDRMHGRPIPRRTPQLLDKWTHPEPITPSNTDGLLTVAETDGLTAVIAESFERDFRYAQAIDMLHQTREGSPSARETTEEIALGALREALKFLHARSRGLVPQAPAILVDGAWHRITAADTELNTALSQRIGGDFLEHVPNPLLGEGPRPTALALVTASFTQMEVHGYNPQQDFWFGTANCLCAPGGHPSC